MNQTEIVQVVINPHTGKPISLDTLRKYFSFELDTGWTQIKSLGGRRYLEALNRGERWAIEINLNHHWGWKSDQPHVEVINNTANINVDYEREFEYLLTSIRAARSHDEGVRPGATREARRDAPQRHDVAESVPRLPKTSTG